MTDSDLWTALAATPWTALPLLAAPIFLLAAAASDAYRFIIPNWTSIGLLAAWPVAWAVSPLGWEAFGLHALVFVVALIASVLLFELGVWGGGDAKLAPCALLWLGWPAALHGLFYISICGLILGVLALLVGTVRRVAATPAPEEFAEGWDDETEPSETEGLARETHAPYGVAIAVGTLLMAGHAPIMAALAPDLAAALR